MKFTLKRYFSMFGLGLGLFSSAPAFAADNWATLQPAYNTHQQTPTVRLEGGSTLVDNLTFYAYGDLDTVQKKSANLETFYSEARFGYFLSRVHDVLSSLGIATEYNGGTGLDDLVRFGIVYTPQLADGNFTLLKIYPAETSGTAGPQVDVFSSQRFTDWLTASLLIDGNIKPRVVYSEPEIDLTYNNAALFGQGRVVWQLGKRPDVQPVVGVKYTF